MLFLPPIVLLQLLGSRVRAISVHVDDPVVHGQNLTATWTRTATDDESGIGVIAPEGQDDVHGLPWFRTSSQGQLKWTSSFAVGQELKNGNYHIIGTDNNGNIVADSNIFAVIDPVTTSENQATPTTSGSTDTDSNTTPPPPSTSTSPSTETTGRSNSGTTSTQPRTTSPNSSTTPQQNTSSSSSSPQDQSTPNAQVSDGSDSQQSKPPTPLIVGVVLGVLALAVIILLLLWCLRRQKQRLRQQEQKPVVDLLNSRPIPVFSDSGTASPVPVLDEKRRQPELNSGSLSAAESSSGSSSTFSAASPIPPVHRTNAHPPVPTTIPPQPSAPPSRPPPRLSVAGTTRSDTNSDAYTALPSFSSYLDGQAMLSQFQQALAEIMRLDSGSTDDATSERHTSIQLPELPTFSANLPPQDMAAQFQQAMEEILRLRAQLRARENQLVGEGGGVTREEAPPAYGIA